MEELIQEQQKTNKLLQEIIDKGNSENELLTSEQVATEYKIGINTVRRMFNDPELPVQKYTMPFRVTRKALHDYMNTRHDYLCERK